MSNNEYKREYILDKSFKDYLEEYCYIFGYDKRIATRIYNSLVSNNFINHDDTVFDFVSNHNRVEINSTITFHNMGERSYVVLLAAIKALGIPLMDEPGYKKMFTNYNKYLEGKNNPNRGAWGEKYDDLEYEFNVLKNQLRKNKEVLMELIEVNKMLDSRIEELVNKVGVEDGKKY